MLFIWWRKVQVVASFEQNLEKMLKRLQNMNTKVLEIIIYLIYKFI